MSKAAGDAQRAIVSNTSTPNIAKPLLLKQSAARNGLKTVIAAPISATNKQARPQRQTILHPPTIPAIPPAKLNALRREAT